MQHLREICAAAGTDQSGASLAQVLRWRTCDLMLLREFYGPSGSLVVAVIRPAHRNDSKGSAIVRLSFQN